MELPPVQLDAPDTSNVSTLNPTELAVGQHNNSIQGLVILCHGLFSALGQKLLDINVAPRISLARDITKPKANLFRDKVLCWHLIFEIKTSRPCTSNWTIVK